MNFQYVHFPPLQQHDAKTVMAEQDDAFIERAYRHWLGRFVNSLNAFNRMQWLNHADLVYQSYLRQYSIHEADFQDNETWQQHRRDCGLSAHEIALDEQDQMIAACEHWLGRPKVSSLKDAFIELYDQIMATALHPFDMAPALNELWFNTVISNTPDTQNRLRRMPYGEYLKTPHWRRVRSAMLLIHKARCARPHGRFDDGAWGEEATMHVHHLTYANRGNERFADLELLCFRCHQEIHSKAS